MAFFLTLSVVSNVVAQGCVENNNVGGIVFSDYNSNGVQDSLEVGQSGLSITAYDSSGGTYGPTTSSFDGTYSISVPNGTAVRVEFSNLPTGLVPASVGVSAGTGTTVQFGVSPNCMLNLGVYDPHSYCQDDPEVAVPCYVNGDPLLGGSSGLSDVLVSFPYSNSGTTTAPHHVATGSEIGSVWGVAYHKKKELLFSAAFLKRYVGLGTQGLGGIYVSDLSLPIPTNVPFINLANLGVNVGSIGDRNLGNSISSASRDSIAFQQVGKIGLGDIDISEDGNTLYVVNLAEKELVSINIANYVNTGALPTANNVQTYDIPNSSCAGGSFRPFGVKAKGGKVYVGVVCSAEATQQRSDLEATVYEFNPTNNLFNEKVSFSLDYIKGALTNFTSVVAGDNCKYWEAWTDNYTMFHHTTLSDGVCYSQPILSDIEFDVDGSMVLGFIDRAGHQLGNDNFPPIFWNNDELSTGVAGGDVIRVYNNNGTFQVESAGVAGNLVGCGTDPNQGINGGEFYCGDFGAGGEKEGSMGGMALLAGSGQLIQTHLNPYATNSGGLIWLNNRTGQRAKRYQLYGNGPAFFGKAHGLGDVELLCGLAQTEIGNYVWEDANDDGIQDANENGLSGVIVNLFGANGNFIAATTTDNNGQYLFNDSNVPNGLNPNTVYYVALSETQYGSQGLNINGNSVGMITGANQGMGSNPDINDSDAISSTDNPSGVVAIDGNDLPYIQVTTQAEGFNNHNADFGLGDEPTTTIGCDQLNTITIAPDLVCSGNSVTITITHVENLGEIDLYYNVGSILTCDELYLPANSGTLIFDNVNTTGVVTTLQYTFPNNNTGAPFPYNIYVALDSNNPNVDSGCCASLDTPIPFAADLEQNFLPKQRFVDALIALDNY